MLDGKTRETLLFDIASGRTPEESKLTYTPEMAAFRKSCEDSFRAWRAKHPDAVLHVAAEVPE